MNKKGVLISILLVIIGAAIGGYMMLNKLFPKADDINIPSTSSVISMTVTKSIKSEEGEIREISLNNIDDILSKLSCAEPTRIMSVQDIPAVQQYYKITVETAERMHYYYIYFEDGTCYAESPYEGVYTIDEGIIVVNNWQLSDDVQTIVSESLLVECDEKDLAIVLCKSKSEAPYTGVIQGNATDLESEIDEMVAHAKEVQ